MRTTLTLEHDVAEKAKVTAQTLGRPFKQVINEALRIGLTQLRQPGPAKPYKTVPHRMEHRPGFSIDNISEVLAQSEGEDWR